jgi:manganese transport protein
MPVWRRIPVFLRRAITMIPALILLAVGFNPTRALVLSQVVLSFGIPFALIPLVAFTAKRSVMGPLVNRFATSAAAITVTAVIAALNVYLLATA